MAEAISGITPQNIIRRMMSMIDGNVLYSLCIRSLIRRLDILAATERERRLLPGSGEEEEAPKVIEIYGKSSRGSKRNKTDRDAVEAMHTVSAYCTDWGLCLS